MFCVVTLQKMSKIIHLLQLCWGTDIVPIAEYIYIFRKDSSRHGGSSCHCAWGPRDEQNFHSQVQEYTGKEVFRILHIYILYIYANILSVLLFLFSLSSQTELVEHEVLLVLFFGWDRVNFLHSNSYGAIF